MTFPITRLRRLRKSAAMRSMVRETRVHTADLVMPMLIVPGKNVMKPIASMPGIYNVSVDTAVEEAKRYQDLGIRSVLLFAVPEYKDDIGSAAWHDNGIIQQSIRAIKERVPGMNVITDLCFCEYTSHGHCGIMREGSLDNDATLDIIVKQTLSHAKHGADMVAPSGMIDGAVGRMREALDQESYHDTAIMAYSAKFASAFYGPFREAVQCSLQKGDRRTYQQDPGNLHESMREMALDIEEGADIIIVKPAMAFLDVVRCAKEQFHVPTAAYNVSGEYSMVKAAAAQGWINGERAMVELLTSIKRAGADIIITYFAPECAQKAKGGLIE
jgi:porphobilinogen synthase